MKKLLVGIVAAVMLLGCAATSKIETATPEAKATLTLATYYETVYWGETKTQERDGIKYMGRDWKTQQIDASFDMRFVTELEEHGPYKVRLVWSSRDHETSTMGLALGMCVDNPETEATLDYCGVIVYKSAQDMLDWIKEFRDLGENVEQCVETVHWSSYPEPYLAELKWQIDESADRVIGE